jgi:hypothetical protein
MKSFKLLIALTLITAFSSCTIQKRLYRNGYSVHWNSINKSSESDFINNEIERSVSELKEENADFVSTSNEIVIIEKAVISLKNENPELKKVQSKNTIDPTKCDVILLKNGEEISAKVLEITPTEVKYKRCDNLEGPTTTIYKSSIFSITYANGSKEVIKTENNTISNNNSNSNENKKNGFGVASLVLGILGGGVLSILAIIFGAIHISKCNKNPESYRGKSMAVAGVILGIFWIAVILFLIFL